MASDFGKVQAVVNQLDSQLGSLESSSIAVISEALTKSFDSLELELRRRMPALEKDSGLLQAQANSLSLVNQVQSLIKLVDPAQAQALQKQFEKLVTESSALGVSMVEETVAIAGMQLDFSPTIPIKAITLAASESIKRLQAHGETFARNATTIITQSLIQGWGVDKAVSLMRNNLAVTKSQAESIVRTESMQAFTGASDAVMADAGIEYVSRLTAVGSSVCPICAGRAGEITKRVETLAVLHVRCLPGETLISSGRIKSGTEREYIGDVVVIKTSAGNKLTGTPNHPVLTDKGWGRLDSLSPGDRVLSSLDGQKIALVVEPDKDSTPARIKEVVTSLRESSGMVTRSVEVSPIDFHGDGVGSKICIVSTDSLLGDEVIHSDRCAQSTELDFQVRTHNSSSLLTDGLSTSLLPGDSPPPARLMTCGNLSDSLGVTHARPLNKFSLRLGSESNAITFETSIDNIPGGVKAVGDRVNGLPSLVASNDSISFERDAPKSLKIQSGSLKDLTHPVIGNAKIKGDVSDSMSQPYPDDSERNFSIGQLLGLLDDTSLSEHGVDNIPTESKLSHEQLDRLASLVFLDEVTGVDRKHFSGLVYNLETSTGWYVANNILTHNCRCVLVPALPGLIDIERQKKFHETVGSKLAKGVKPDPHKIAPFEKANGMAKPKPVWDYYNDSTKHFKDKLSGKLALKKGAKVKGKKEKGEAIPVSEVDDFMDLPEFGKGKKNPPQTESAAKDFDEEDGDELWKWEKKAGNERYKPLKKLTRKKADPTAFVYQKPKSYGEELSLVKGLGGSTGAELVEDSKGNQFVRKRGASKKHLEEEMLADSLYRILGVDVPEGAIYVDEVGEYKLTRFIKGKALGELTKEKKAEVEKVLSQNFAIDALLGNWDVVGMSEDNVLIDDNGRVYRIDNGGSLRYRAQGEKKDGGDFSSHAGEIWSMRGIGENASSSKAFTNLDIYEVAKQIKGIDKTRIEEMEEIDPQVKSILLARIEEMGRFAEIAEVFKDDKWNSDYTDKFLFHVNGLRSFGIVDEMPQSLTSEKENGTFPETEETVELWGYMVQDEAGRVYDRLRGSNGLTSKLKNYMAFAGGDYSIIERYAEKQGASSWAPMPCLFKEVFVSQRSVSKEKYWNGGSPESVDQKIKREKKGLHERGLSGKLLDSIAAQHAYNYELLRKTNFDTKSKDGKTIRVFRTESDEQLERYGLNFGDKKIFKKGALESVSMFDPVSAVAGNAVTIYDVPLHRMFANYITSPTDACLFLVDLENEATVILEGLEAHYVGLL